MNINDIKKVLGDLFVPRDNDLEGVCFNYDFMNKDNADKYAICQAVSNVMHESGLTHNFSYEIASRAVNILGEVEDWTDDDTIRELVDSYIPIYTGEVMEIYQSNSWAVDEAVKEFGNNDSDSNAKMGWYMQISQMTDNIKSSLLDLVNDND